MGIKSCTNCNNICSEKDKKLETNLSNLHNKIEHNYYLFDINSFNKTYFKNYKENMRLCEIIILNKVRKIIKAYKEYLNKHKIIISQRQNYSNLNLIFKKYSNDLIKETNNKEISSKSLFNIENNFNECNLSTSENDYISHKKNEKTIDYSKMENPKILFKNKTKKKKSCLKLNNKGRNNSNTKRKNVSFVNPNEINILGITNSMTNLNSSKKILLNNNQNITLKRRNNTIITGLKRETNQSSNKNKHSLFYKNIED